MRRRCTIKVRDQTLKRFAAIREHLRARTFTLTTQEIRNRLDYSAGWRRRTASEYPNDNRSREAAILLTKLADEASYLEGTTLFSDLKAAIEVMNKDQLDTFNEQENEYRRAIGFHVFPASIEDYVVGLSRSSIRTFGFLLDSRPCE